MSLNRSLGVHSYVTLKVKFLCNLVFICSEILSVDFTLLVFLLSFCSSRAVIPDDIYCPSLKLPHLPVFGSECFYFSDLMVLMALTLIFIGVSIAG